VVNIKKWLGVLRHEKKNLVVFAPAGCEELIYYNIFKKLKKKW